MKFEWSFFSIYSNISDYMKTDYDVDGDQVLSQSLFPLSMKVTTNRRSLARRLKDSNPFHMQPTNPQ